MSESRKIRVAVVGVGDFGRHHVRIYRELDAAELVGVFDTDAARARAVAAEFGTVALPDLDSLVGRAEAASVAVPTTAHARVGCWLLERGVDVLVEKPMAASLAEADALIEAARRHHRILQVGHLERFNPAVVAAQRIVRRPLFFEVHRLGVFTPRSLDVDVIYDVMIHDLDILLTLAGAEVAEVRAVGIPILTDKVDIAHARIEFTSGAVANLTASRVSTERVRKLRFFQEHEYISIDYTRQDLLRVRLAPAAAAGAHPQFQFEKLPTEPEEPLRAELRAFLQAVQTRCPAPVDGRAGRRALELADRVMHGILEHARRVQPGGLTPPAQR
ncbi:MAG: Gfo/Idh/MocA family oxidoreductase [Acidobacteriia bacterium]|mgnify:CR=1 FL=1|nr:Gfo/Idh/MocA family oxidoreductase [Terriglobia bacterium]